MPEKLMEGLGAQDVADLLDFIRQAERPVGSVTGGRKATGGSLISVVTNQACGRVLAFSQPPR